MLLNSVLRLWWRLLVLHRGLLLLLGWCQFEVLAKLAQIVHVTPHDDLALGLRRRRLLHLLLLLLGRSSGTSLVDVRRWHSNVVRRHDDLLGLNLLLLLLLLIVGHHLRWRHVSGMVRMSYVHRRFAHGLHLGAGASLLWSQRWRRFGVVGCRARILPHGTLRQRLSVTIYIHAAAAVAATATVGHFPAAIAVHLVHIRVTIYNRRLAMLLLLLLLMGLLMLNVAAVRRLVRVHRAVLRRATTVLLIAWWNLLLLLLLWGHRHVLIAVVLVWRSLWAQWLLLLRLLLLRRQRLLLRLRLLLLLQRRLLLWKGSSSVVGQRRWRASGGQLARVTLALGRHNVLCVRWHHRTLVVHTIRVLC